MAGWPPPAAAFSSYPPLLASGSGAVAGFSSFPGGRSLVPAWIQGVADSSARPPAAATHAAGAAGAATAATPAAPACLPHPSEPPPGTPSAEPPPKGLARSTRRRRRRRRPPPPAPARSVGGSSSRGDWCRSVVRNPNLLRRICARVSFLPPREIVRCCVCFSLSVPRSLFVARWSTNPAINPSTVLAGFD